MSAQNPQISNPRFGFSPKQLVTATLTDTSLFTALTPRTAGLQSVVVIGECAAFAGGGSVSLVIEGSNGAGYVVLAETQATELFTAAGQTRILNDAFDGLVDLEHWRLIRVSAVVIAGAPTFTINVKVSGIARDAEKFLKGGAGTDGTFGPRSGTTPTLVAKDSWPRPAGTLMANCQVSATGVNLGGLASFDVVLQGSPNGGTDWYDIATVPVTASALYVMDIDGERFFSLGAWYTLRVIVRDNGVATGATAYTTIRFFLSMDSSDWVIDDSSGGGSSLSDAFLSVAFGTPGAEALNVIAITGQVYDSSGAPVAAAKKIELIVYDTTQVGDLDLALNATFTAVNTGTAIAGIGTNRLVLTTDASGAFDIDVTDAAVESVFLCAVNPAGPVPLSSPQLIAASEEATLAFT